MKARTRKYAIRIWVLAVVCVVLAWARSLWVCDAVMWGDRHRDYGITSSAGRATVTMDFWPAGRAPYALRYAATSRAQRRPWWEDDTWQERHRWLGFEWSENVFPPRPDGSGVFLSFHVAPWRIVAVPYWAILLALLLLRLPRLRRDLRRQRRIRDGLCADCGYDLRGSDGRCPECGAAALSSPDRPR